ncbi:hypothetical protein DGG96_19785 [Legionella qingyii]|uniref:Uncharacterized protein n=1 Tax=Legionella qingyii TaxID=2184757 RepID=A0A317TWY6_9GAMM|nr:hypothetical protein DGG96_19785 [Legionella qingyii]
MSIISRDGKLDNRCIEDRVLVGLNLVFAAMVLAFQQGVVTDRIPVVEDLKEAKKKLSLR